jgi:hypothetical protein
VSHRRLILGRALIAGAAGLVPLPYLDDLLSGTVRGGMIRALAERRQVDVDPAAVAELSTPAGSRLLSAANLGALAWGTRRAWRRVAASLLVVRRADEAVQTFQIGTLFDHYCAQHHVGLGLDAARAAVLRSAMDEAVHAAHRGSVERVFRRALRAPVVAVAGLIGLPRGARALWLRLRGGPVEPVEIVQLADDAHPAAVESRGWLRRAVDGLDRELGGAYERALTDAFDAAWKARR